MSAPRLGDICANCGERFGAHYGGATSDYPEFACLQSSGGVKFFSRSHVFLPIADNRVESDGRCRVSTLLTAIERARNSARVAELDLRLAVSACQGQGAAYLVLVALVPAAVEQHRQLYQLAAFLEGEDLAASKRRAAVTTLTAALLVDRPSPDEISKLVGEALR